MYGLLVLSAAGVDPTGTGWRRVAEDVPGIAPVATARQRVPATYHMSAGQEEETMARSRPPGGRPPNQRGRGGIGPGPAYRPSSTGGGSKHKSSSVEGSPIIRVVYALAAFVALTGGSVVGYLLHGYGVL